MAKNLEKESAVNTPENLGNSVRIAYASYLERHESLPAELKVQLNEFYDTLQSLGENPTQQQIVKCEKMYGNLIAKLNQGSDYAYKA
jgi:hypothetical protein